MKTIIFIVVLVSIVGFFKYKSYKRLKDLAYGYKYGIDNYKKYLNFKKNNNQADESAYINYKNLKKEEIKILNEERIIDLLYISEYGKKDYELYKKYKLNQISDLTNEQLEQIKNKEQKIFEAKDYGVSKEEISHLDMMYGPVEKTRVVNEKVNDEEKRRFQPILLIPILCFLIAIISAIVLFIIG